MVLAKDVVMPGVAAPCMLVIAPPEVLVRQFVYCWILPFICSLPGGNGSGGIAWPDLPMHRCRDECCTTFVAGTLHNQTVWS